MLSTTDAFAPDEDFGRWRLATLLTFVLALSACDREEGTEPAATLDSLKRPDTAPISATDSGEPSVECEGLETSILVAPATRAGLRREFGVPDSTTTTTEPNRHVPGAIDSLFLVYYPGLTVRLRKPPDGRDLPEHVQITKTGYVRYPDLGIGAESSRIIEILGEPTGRDDSTLVYDCGMATEQPVIFHMRDGTVEFIEISYYVD